MNIKKIFFFKISIIVYIFLFSLYFLHIYTLGDQKAYISFWNNIVEFNFIDGFSYYHAALSSYEIGYYSIVYLFSNILNLDKNIFISLSNVVLAFLVFKFFIINKVDKFLAFIFVISNFYILVLYFSAERLKFAIIFLLLVLLIKSKNLFYFFVPLSFHLSIAIIYVVTLSKEIIYNLLKFKIKKQALIFIFGLFFMFVLFNIQIFYKISSYWDTYGGPFEWIKTFIFYILVLLYTPKIKIFEVSCIFLTLSLFSIIVGDIRVNMFSYIFFLYYFIIYERVKSIPFLAIYFYFMIKGLFFLYQILLYGDGFANI